MKKSILFLTLLTLAIVYSGCDDENDKQFNTLEITSGDFDGYTHEYFPNLGFWSTVGEGVRYVHLVLGDEDNMAIAGEDVMSIVFYHTGTPMVHFPSTEGQWANFGINYNGTVYYFGAEDADLTIFQFDDLHFSGNMSGTFVDMADGENIISFSMDISVDLQEI
jgi:hypothetical protein